VKSVYFHTDEAVHKKFKMMCAIKGDNMGKILTGLMQNYVAENKGLIDNPEIQENLPPELPEFYESQDKWSAYVRKSNKERIENMATRIMFLRYLIHLHLIDRDEDGEIKLALRDRKFFTESADHKFLLEYGMVGAVRSMGKEHDLSEIKPY
jgi:hypothetical protein